MKFETLMRALNETPRTWCLNYYVMECFSFLKLFNSFETGQIALMQSRPDHFYNLNIPDTKSRFAIRNVAL